MIRLLYRIRNGGVFILALAICLCGCDLELPELVPGVPILLPKTDATLTWEVPKLNSDGTPCTDLAGFKIYHAQEEGLCRNQIVTPLVLEDPRVDFYRFRNLNPGRHYFSITAYDESGNESACSDETTIEL